MSTFRDHLLEEMKDPEFAKAWEETELEYQIARAIIKLRMERGLTQEELAKQVGVTQSVIARLESGRHLPSLRSLHELAEKLGLKLVVNFEP
ncbi:XRE family transcriptional regulator [Clostridiales bacterium PH28_bin88]|nr:XRE family transcriptional regulator [Clostridiales bacterium PH28_bin88]